MENENLQLRNCADCEYYGGWCCYAYQYQNGCDLFESAYKSPERMKTTPDSKQIYIDGWKDGFKAGAESVLHPFHRDENISKEAPKYTYETLGFLR